MTNESDNGKLPFGLEPLTDTEYDQMKKYRSPLLSELFVEINPMDMSAAVNLDETLKHASDITRSFLSGMTSTIRDLEDEIRKDQYGNRHGHSCGGRHKYNWRKHVTRENRRSGDDNSGSKGGDL
jgi:hypothetical protein